MVYDEIERNYRTTLSKTNLRSDRGDLRLYTFAGSNLHGGTPAVEKVQAPKGKGSTTTNIYAPIAETPYGSGYYDHLRATTPEPRKRKSPKLSSLEDEPVTYSRLPRYDIDVDPLMYTRPMRYEVSSHYKTLPSRLSDLESDLKTTRTTRTSESWVPLTTHIYNTPFHTYIYKASPFSSYTYRTADDLYDYSYADDYKRYSTSTTKKTTKNVEALDMSTTSKIDYNSYVEKCSNIESQLNEVNRWMSEAETKIKSEVVTSRNSIQKDLAYVASVVEDTAKYNDELHEAIRKQSKQISNLSSKYENINKNVSEVLETLDRTKVRCETLQSELSSLKSSLEMGSTKTTTTRTEFLYM